MATKSSKTANEKPAKRFKGRLTNKDIKALIKEARQGKTIKLWRAARLGPFPKPRYFKSSTAKFWYQEGRFVIRYESDQLTLTSSDQYLFLNFWLAYACHCQLKAEWLKEQEQSRI